MSKDLAIAISVGSKNSTLDLVKKTFTTIEKNIGQCDWKIFLLLGPKVSIELRDYVIKKVENSDNYEIISFEDMYWSEFINLAIEKSKEYKYFIKSHDDIELITDNFFEKVIFELERLKTKNIGWISFTDIGWKRGDFSPPVRIGYFKDVREKNAWNKRKVFQFHKFPDDWTKTNNVMHYIYRFYNIIHKFFFRSDLPYPKPIKKISTYEVDIPDNTVIAHAPFNHFVMIKRSILDSIGKCEHWETFNALLVDEDWGLRCMEKNIVNIWIPSIEYFHYRGIQHGGATRSWSDITDKEQETHNKFYQKWKFHAYPSSDEIEYIQDKYQNTMIPWSINRNSYDWDYVK